MHECMHCHDPIVNRDVESIDPADCKISRFCSRECRRHHHRTILKNKMKHSSIKNDTETLDNNDTFCDISHPDDNDTAFPDKCPICLEMLARCDDVVVLPSCSHAIHINCLEQLRNNGLSQKCPLCREMLPPPPDELYYNAMEGYRYLCCQISSRPGEFWKLLSDNQADEMEFVLSMLHSAALEGHTSSQFQLGIMFLQGRGARHIDEEHNDSEALRFLGMAAKSGHPRANFNLGLMHHQGRGLVKNNDREAARCWMVAATSGHVKAQYNLGSIYEKGRGVEQNELEAVRWYTMAANAGCTSSMLCLFFLYHEGRGGVPQNSERGFDLLRQATAAGNEAAIELLSEIQSPDQIPGHFEDVDSASVQLHAPAVPSKQESQEVSAKSDAHTIRMNTLLPFDRRSKNLDKAPQRMDAPKKKTIKGRPAWR